MQSEDLKQSIKDLLRLGLEKFGGGRFPEAAETFRRVLQLDPRQPDGLHLLGLSELRLGNKERAVQLIGAARTLRPDVPQFAYSLASAHAELNRFHDVLAALDDALRIKPDFPEALFGRGFALFSLKRYADALQSYDELLRLVPQHVDALNNRGSTLYELRRYEEALASFDAALTVAPNHSGALLNRGNTLRELGRYKEAIASYDKLIAIDPGAADAHATSSLCRLLIADFKRGWPEYEWRLRLSEFRNSYPQPAWRGKEDLSGKTIVLYAEQGFGDTIQFVRYVEALTKKRARVFLHVQPALRKLLSNLPDVEVLSQKEPLPQCDFQCPLMSLPLALDTALDSIPASIPYLSATPEAIKKWEAILGQEKKLRVGVVWSGGTATKHDFKRSIPLDVFLGMLRPPVQMISLQRDVRPQDQETLEAHTEILHFGPRLEDFSDTAALVSLMDTVVTVDTSVAHLAGAMGKQVWILLPFVPDWRWLLERSDSPWYPTAQLFRQPKAGDWASVMAEVGHRLATLKSY